MRSQSVSIALATYNGARYIAEQLESLAQQTVLPDELVVSDDASSDETLSIVATFATEAPFPVRIEKNAERLGYRANFMKAAHLCKSDLIAFCDQDDVWLPLKLAACLATFEHKQVLLTYHNATVVTETLEPVGSLDNRAPPYALNDPQSIEPWKFGLGFTLMFRSILLTFAHYWPHSTDFSGPNNPEAHDQWLFFLASCLGTIGYVKEPLVLYRQHSCNAYGWRIGRPGLRGTLDNLRMPTAKGLHAREITAGKRAAILEQVKKRIAEEQRDRAALAALGYRKLETAYRRRKEIYLADTRLSKLFRLAAVIASGVYRPQKRWGVGPKALISDMLQVFFLPRPKRAA